MKQWRQRFVEGAVKTSGVSEDFANEIFSQIEKFAGYGFNKSHASAYSLISYICMWLKVHYPIEFFAGVLSHVKSDRRAVVLADMKRLGLKLLPRDINQSSDVFEPLNSTSLLAPFSAVLGVSDNTAAAIIAARKRVVQLDAKGELVIVDSASEIPFTDKADFVARVERRRCNVRHVANLDAVGTFSRIEPGQVPADHHSRRAQQMELMQGLIIGHVMIDRPIEWGGTQVEQLAQVIEGYKACDRCELAGLCHPKPWLSGKPQVMIVLDGPSYKEEAADEMGVGTHIEAIEDSLAAIGKTLEDVYITALLKSPKPEKTKEWPKTAMTECPAWLEQEIAIIRPPLIIALGTLAVKHFNPGLKGGAFDNAGQVIYDRKRECNILLGFSPGAIHFDSGKQATLDAVIAKIPDLLPS